MSKEDLQSLQELNRKLLDINDAIGLITGK